MRDEAAKSNRESVDVIMNELHKCLYVRMIEGILHVLAGCLLLNVKSATGLDVCSNENLSLRCESDAEVLLVGDSYYGRLHRGSRCLKDVDQGPIGCAVNATPFLAPLCSGRRTCNVTNVKDALEKVSACRSNLESYLQLDYKCVRATVPSIPCADGPNGHVIVHTPSSTSGRLTSLDSRCAWLIRSAPGLRMNLTLEDVLPREPCLDIARVSEGSDNDGVVLRSCGVGNSQRSSVLRYVSRGNEVKVEMVAEGDEIYERFFIIDYKIYGCAYPPIPLDSIVVDRRWSDGTGAIWIQCRHREESRTLLVCTQNGLWTGNTSLNCPAAGNDVDAEATENWLPFGLMLLLTTGIALLVCFVILGSGLFYLYHRKRHYRTDVLLRPIRPNPTRRSAHPLATPIICDASQPVKFHTLPLTQLHRHYTSTLPRSQRPVCPVRPTGFGGRSPMPVPVPRVPELTPLQLQCTCTRENTPRGRGQTFDSDQSGFSGRDRGVGTGQSDYAPLTAFSTFKPELESPYEDPNESFCKLEPLNKEQ